MKNLKDKRLYFKFIRFRLIFKIFIEYLVEDFLIAKSW